MDLNTYNQYVAEGYNHIPVFRTESIDTETAKAFILNKAINPTLIFLSLLKGARNGVDFLL